VFVVPSVFAGYGIPCCISKGQFKEICEVFFSKQLQVAIRPELKPLRILSSIRRVVRIRNLEKKSTTRCLMTADSKFGLREPGFFFFFSKV
jgi:hypothetical protein